MNIEQKIGQMMMVGWQTDKSADIVRLIKEYNFGNVILFTRNIKNSDQLIKVCRDIQQAAMDYNGVPCFIGIDQEGGNIRRIYDGVTPVPGNMAISAASSHIPDAAAQIGRIVGEELKYLGVNLNLAPVVDINTNPNNPIIAIRAFGDNPAIVSRLASDYAQYLQKSGVMACYKHFLGHGDIDVDSHLELPRSFKTMEDLEMCELVPYKAAQLSDAIMSVHILYKELDDFFPASVSGKILNGILRKRLGYKGLIVTDCFEMDGLIKAFSLEEAAAFAVNATTDIITVSHTFGRQLQVRNGLISGYKNGVISEETISASLERILAMKKKYCTPAEKVPDFVANDEVSRGISRASVSIISGKPFDIDEGTVVVGVTNFINSIAEDTNVEKMDVAKEIGAAFNIKSKSIDNKNFNLNDTLDFARGKKVILCLADSHLTLVQGVLYSSMLRAAESVMLISLRTPYDILHQDKPACHICTYEYTRQSCAALLEVLAGGRAYGECPVKLNFKGYYAADSGAYLIERIVQYIKLNYSKKLTLDSVAEEFMISGGHLCKLMKKKLNKGFSDFVNDVRIGEAKRLLSVTNLKVYEIAFLCGYSEYEYFAYLFKKYNGVTPTNFRSRRGISD